jgi:hypothetical protein
MVITAGAGRPMPFGTIWTGAIRAGTAIVPGPANREGSVAKGSVLKGSVLKGSVAKGSVPKEAVRKGSIPKGAVPKGLAPAATLLEEVSREGVDLVA